jgi:hypothetical protein
MFGQADCRSRILVGLAAISSSANLLRLLGSSASFGAVPVFAPKRFPVAVGLYIKGAYWFTASLCEKVFGRLHNLIDQLVVPHSISKITCF